MAERSEKRIDELPATATISDTSKIPMEQNGEAVYFEAGTLKDYTVAGVLANPSVAAVVDFANNVILADEEDY